MPILGANLPADLVEKTRDYLKDAIEANDYMREVIGREVKLELTRLSYTGDYVLKGHKGSAFFPIAKFGILPMPGCKGVVIFHHSEVEQAYRGKHLGRELLRVRQIAAKKAGYSIAVATVRNDNTIQKNLLLSEKWTVISQFQNKRTGNWVSMYQKTL